MGSFSFLSFELLRRLRITQFICIKIGDRNNVAVLDLAFTQIVQVRPPMAVLCQIFGDTLREQDVTGIAAIHHPLRDVNSRAGDIRPLVHIDNPANRSAVHAHPQLKFRVFF